MAISARERLPEILTEVKDYNRKAADLLVTTRDMHMRQDGLLEVKGEWIDKGVDVNGVFDCTAWAEGQLLGKLGMPPGYFRKVKSLEAYELYQSHFNFWVRELEEREFMFRTWFDKANERGRIRGVVSPRYAVFDNQDLLHTLTELIHERFLVQEFNLNDQRMHLRIVDSDERNAGYLPDQTVDSTRVGFDFLNSEVGASSLMMIPMVLRLVCTNGLMAWTREGCFTRRHIYLERDEFKNLVSDQILNQYHNSLNLLSSFTELQDVKLDYPTITIRNIAKDYKLPQEFTDEVVKEYESGRDSRYDPTAYGVVNSYNRTARDIENTDRRLELERLAGRLVFTPVTRWNLWDSEN